MITLELTEQEAQNLAEIIDLAVKSGGVNAGRVGVPLFDKLMKAARPPEKNNEESQLTSPE